MGRKLTDHNRKALERLQDNQLYAASHIVTEAEEVGLLDHHQANLFRRSTLFRAAKDLGPPDGFRPFPRQGELRAWYGRKWKKALLEDA